MKLFVTFIVSLFMSLQAFAQDALVPYRVGNTFGLSDLKGKIKVEPVYDKLTLAGINTFEFSKGDQGGILYEGKELLSGSYFFDFEIVKDNYIITEGSAPTTDGSGRQRKGKLKLLYNFKGKQVLPDAYKSIQTINEYGNLADEKRYTIFRTTGTDDLESLYIYDAKLQKITETLLKNCKRIDVDRAKIVYGKVFKVTMPDGTTKQMALKFNGDTFAFTPLNSVDLSQKAEDKDMPVIRTYDGGGMDVGVELPNPKKPGDKASPSAYTVKRYASKLTFANNVLTTTYMAKHGMGSVIATKSIKLPEGATDLKIGNWIEYFNEKGKEHISYNYATYTVNGKKGFFITDTIQVPPVYDALEPLKFTIGARATVVCVVAKKNAAGILKYGIIDINNTVLVPLVYEEITYNFDEEASRSKSVKTAVDILKVKKDGKYGFINGKDKVLIPIKYDEAKKGGYLYKSFVLIKDGKYGLFTPGSQFSPTEYVDALFPFEVGDFYHDYNGQKGVTLITLEQKRTFFCFATPDGQVYYKE